MVYLLNPPSSRAASSTENNFSNAIPLTSSLFISLKRTVNRCNTIHVRRHEQGTNYVTHPNFNDSSRYLYLRRQASAGRLDDFRRLSEDPANRKVGPRSDL